MNNIESKELKRFMFSHGFWTVARTMFRIFINIYIWTLTKSIAMVAVFEIVFLLAHSVSFTLWAPLAKKGYNNRIRIGGIIGVCIVFFAIFLMQHTTAEYIVPIAVAYGFFNGMYWLAYHILVFDLTHTKNRGNFAGLDRAINITGNLIGPMLGGFLITADFFGFGYGNIFLFGIASMFVAVLIGTIAAPEHKTRPFHLRETIKRVFQNADMRRSMVSNAASNFGQNGALRALIPLFLFTVLANEFEVGSWITFFTILSIFTSLLIGKYVQYKQYKAMALGAGGVLSVSLMMLIAAPTLAIYILYGSIKELVSPISKITRNVYYQNLLHTFSDYRTHRVEYLVIREWINLVPGRIFSFIPLLFISTFTSTSMFILIIAMAIATFIDPLAIWRIRTDVTKL